VYEILCVILPYLCSVIINHPPLVSEVYDTADSLVNIRILNIPHSPIKKLKHCGQREETKRHGGRIFRM